MHVIFFYKVKFLKSVFVQFSFALRVCMKDYQIGLPLFDLDSHLHIASVVKLVSHLFSKNKKKTKRNGYVFFLEKFDWTLFQCKKENRRKCKPRFIQNSCFPFLQEELRPFLSLPKVIDGLFNLSKMLFDIEIDPADGLAPVISTCFLHSLASVC